MKKINKTGITFGLCFTIITIIRWSNIAAIDKAFYCMAIIGLLILAIAPLFSKQKDA
jgi:hypothetical protein